MLALLIENSFPTNENVNSSNNHTYTVNLKSSMKEVYNFLEGEVVWVDLGFSTDYTPLSQDQNLH